MYADKLRAIGNADEILVDMKSVQIKKRTQRTAGQDAVHDRSAVSSDISVAETQTEVNTQSMQDGFQLSLVPNQFANETIQRLSAFSEETKAVLAGSAHEVVPNAERMDPAWQAPSARRSAFRTDGTKRRACV